MHRVKRFYIYRTTCEITGRFYVGMHTTYNLDDGYLGSGTIIKHSIRKYGRAAHKKSIIEFCSSLEAMKTREKEIITPSMLADPMCMNIREGGQGGLAPETREQIIARWRQLAETDPEWSATRRATYSAAARKSYADGRDKSHLVKQQADIVALAWTPDARAKRSLTHQRTAFQQGKNNNQYGSRWVCKDGVARKIKGELLQQYLDDGYHLGRK